MDTEMLTKQEVFDKVVIGLRKQGCRSYLSDEDTCAYRGVDGRKCAAGILILDEFYSSDLEGETIPTIWPRLSIYKDHRYKIGQALISSGVNPAHFLFIRSLQQIHDEERPGHWEQRWSALAFDEGVKYTPPSAE